MTINEAIVVYVSLTTFVVGGIDWLIRKWLQKHRDELIGQLTRQVDALTSDVNGLRQELTKERHEVATVTADRDRLAKVASRLEVERDQSAEQVKELMNQLSILSGKHDVLTQVQKSHANRIRRALGMEGAIWTQPVMAGTPRFRPLAERRTPIVSVLNLKGGVGKTTLTAYLGWALAKRGYRVLMVDLDLQGSLSSLFVPGDQLAQLAKQGGCLLQHFLTGVVKDKKTKLLDHTLSLPAFGPKSRLVGATDKLAYAELSQTVQWLLRVGGTSHQWSGQRDGRMILRRALHAKGLYQKFDVVLLDCPPLINLCCANALAASDFVLVPVTPSRKAIERVPPLLKRVHEIKSNGVNPDLHALGLVVNRSQEKSLTSREADLIKDLPSHCYNVLQEQVEVFDTVVPQRVHIRDGEDEFAPPDDRSPLTVTFEQLAEEFVKRLPDYCRRPGEGRPARRVREGEL